MDRFTPMLCAKYTPRLTKFPVMVQPKFNGYRCLLSKDDCWTRGLKDHNPDLVWHMFNQIQKRIPDYWVLDGEIYCHGVALQDIISLGKSWRLESSKLKFIVYDMYDRSRQGAPFANRWKWLKAWLNIEPSSYIDRSPCNTLMDEAIVEETATFWIDKGYEGVIIRNPDASYHFGKKGRDLQKLKKWEDAEWVVVDVTEGVGKYKGRPVFHCKSTYDVPFKVCMNGSYRELARLYRDRDKLIGKLITIRYNELSNDKVPCPARALAIRDYE